MRAVPVTPKLVKKVITDFDSSKLFGPDCIPVVVLKNCQPELSYFLLSLFKMCQGILFPRLMEGLICDPYM